MSDIGFASQNQIATILVLMTVDQGFCLLSEKDLFVYEGQNVMVKGDKDTQPRKVPLCNRCITLYHTKGWLVTK